MPYTYVKQIGIINYMAKMGVNNIDCVGQVVSVASMPMTKESVALTSGESSLIYVVVQDSKLATKDNAGAIAFITANPITLTYQLATPVTTRLLPGSLKAYQNGTLIVEPAVYDVGRYSTNIAIANTAIPIKALDFVNKINVDTGSFTAVPLANVTVAGDGLSFTVTGAASGDFYDYAYMYDQSLSTIPSVSYSYTNNLKAQVNGNTDNIQSLMRALSALQSEVAALKLQIG
jgi:hypothetical protein